MSPKEANVTKPGKLPEVTVKAGPAFMKVLILNNCVVEHTAYSAGKTVQVPFNQGKEMISRGLAKEVDPRLNLEDLNKPATKESLAALSGKDLAAHLDTLDATDEVKAHIKGLPKDEAIEAILQLRLPGKPNTPNPPPGPVDLDQLKRDQLSAGGGDGGEGDEGGEPLEKLTIAELLDEALDRGVNDERYAELTKLRKAELVEAVKALPAKA